MRDNYRAWGSALGRLDLCSARQSVFFFSWIEYQLISWVICCSGNWVKGWEHTQHIQPSHPENGRKKRESVVWVSLRRHFGWCRIIWISHTVVQLRGQTMRVQQERRLQYTLFTMSSLISCLWQDAVWGQFQSNLVFQSRHQQHIYWIRFARKAM